MMLLIPWYRWALEASAFPCPWNYSVLAQCAEAAR